MDESLQDSKSDKWQSAHIRIFQSNWVADPRSARQSTTMTPTTPACHSFDCRPARHLPAASSRRARRRWIGVMPQVEVRNMALRIPLGGPLPETPTFSSALAALPAGRRRSQGMHALACAPEQELKSHCGSTTETEWAVVSPLRENVDGPPQRISLPSASTTLTSPSLSARTGASIFFRSPTMTQVRASGLITSRAAASMSAFFWPCMRALSVCT